MSKTLGPPMTLANMRQNGVRAVIATCGTCGHKADVNVDALPATIAVPKASHRLRCGRCGSKRVDTRPAWHTKPNPRTLLAATSLRITSP
jgi:DNA-directed RNA polymerase subunit RPC12/RpoP